MGGRKSKAADVYSFGMLLYEVYTGDMPFSGGLSKEIIYMQVGGASGRRDWDTNQPSPTHSLNWLGNMSVHGSLMSQPHVLLTWLPACQAVGHTGYACMSGHTKQCGAASSVEVRPG
jgi:hypothetical protein